MWPCIFKFKLIEVNQILTVQFLSCISHILTVQSHIRISDSHTGLYRYRPCLSLWKALWDGTVQGLSVKTGCMQCKLTSLMQVRSDSSCLWSLPLVCSFLLGSIMQTVDKNVFCTHTGPAWNYRGYSWGLSWPMVNWSQGIHSSPLHLQCI